MHNHYTDIIDKIELAPLWFDEQGVPRFCEFSPKRLSNIYADSCCLLRIECQGCGHQFAVAMSDSRTQLMLLQHRSGRPIRRLAELVRNGSIHYGDPPNVSCCPSGPTMNSIPRQVVQFWVRESFDWKPVDDLERLIDCKWADDDA